MRKDNHAYFVLTEKNQNKPQDNGSKILFKHKELHYFKNLCIWHAQEFHGGLQYRLALPIECELNDNLSDTFRNIALSIYSLHPKPKILKLRTISIAKTPLCLTLTNSQS